VLIEADREVCAGAGLCALGAPELFDQDEVDGRVLVLQARPGPEDVLAAARAVARCPSGALSLRELDGPPQAIEVSGAN
jgi:ferredoxin